MTFAAIINNFKNHDYIRRESWPSNTFIQLRLTCNLIRYVAFIDSDTTDIPEMRIINNDVRFSAEDVLAEDWIIKN